MKASCLFSTKESSTKIFSCLPCHTHPPPTPQPPLIHQKAFLKGRRVGQAMQTTFLQMKACTTAAHSPNSSNVDDSAACLGFLLYLFSWQYQINYIWLYSYPLPTQMWWILLEAKYKSLYWSPWCGETGPDHRQASLSCRLLHSKTVLLLCRLDQTTGRLVCLVDFYKVKLS